MKHTDIHMHGGPHRHVRACAHTHRHALIDHELIFIVNVLGFNITMKTHLWVCLKLFAKRFNRAGKTYCECRQPHPMD